MIKVKNLADIIKYENIGHNVVEKLAGNTPKPALNFFQYYKRRLKYLVLNLGDSSEAYFDRAYDLANGLDLGLFKNSVKYVPFVNVYRDSVRKFTKHADAIIYWGAATKCLQAFDEKQELAYLKIVENERNIGLKHRLDAVTIHKNIRKAIRKQKLFREITYKELVKIFKDDLMVLKLNGVMLTNSKKDTKQVKRALKSLGLKSIQYYITEPKSFLEYERHITVWR